MNPSSAIYDTNQATLDRAPYRGMGSSTGIRGATLQRSSKIWWWNPWRRCSGHHQDLPIFLVRELQLIARNQVVIIFELHTLFELP